MADGDEKKQIRILLVDDIAEARDSIKKLLAFEHDFKVVGDAANGRDGVQKAKELKPDIVIMDINMPDMDGLEAAGRITRALPMVGVVMMSVQDDPDYMQRAMMAGARFFLSKPPSMDQLYSTIRNVYSQYEPIRRRIKQLEDTAGSVVVVGGDDDEEGPVGRTGHIIAVYSPQGGAGCTTIATSLASGLMKEGVKTLLIDANLEFGDVGMFLDARSNSTIADLVEEVGELDLDFIESVVFTHNSGVKVLLAPARPAAGAELRNTSADSIISVIRQISVFYDFVVIDCNRSLDTITTQILEMAEKVVLVTLPTLPCIKNVRHVLDLFTNADYPQSKTTLVVNKAIENPTKIQKVFPTPERIQGFLRHPVEGVIPLVEEGMILNAVNKGVPVIAADRDVNKAPMKQLRELSDRVYRNFRAEKAKPDAAAQPAETAPKEKEKRGWLPFGRG
jgi:pilus assembly protein CpaE